MTIFLMILLITGIIYNYCIGKYDPWMLLIAGIFIGFTVWMLKLPSFEDTVTWAYYYFK